MTILALDLATRLGWAVSYGDTRPGAIDYGVIEFRAGRHEGGGMQWVRFRKWLYEMHDDHGPIDEIYYEEVRRHNGTTAAHVYGGFLAVLSSWCEKLTTPLPYKGIPVGTIKRHATGKGNSGKPLVIAAMRAKGFNPTDDNDADALALLLCVTDKKVHV